MVHFLHNPNNVAVIGWYQFIRSSPPNSIQLILYAEYDLYAIGSQLKNKRVIAAVYGHNSWLNLAMGSSYILRTYVTRANSGFIMWRLMSASS